MRYTREQKRAELLKAAEAMIDEFLDWEEQAAEPDLSAIEAAVLKVRRQISERMAVVAIEDQDAARPVAAPVMPAVRETNAQQGPESAHRREFSRDLAVQAGLLPLSSLQT